MEGKKYLVYVDIMGFQNLAEKIAKEKQIEERKVRVDFLNIIKERVEAIEARKEIIGMSCGRDDWILVACSIDLVFKILFELLDHNTGYKNYEKIPLEIAIGIGEYDKWAKFKGANLIIEGSTIKFLKTKIVEYYHKWYKESHNGQSPVSTFVVFVPLAYQELEPLDRRMCRRIEYRFGNGSGKERTVIFFVADVEQIFYNINIELENKIIDVTLSLIEKVEYAIFGDLSRIWWFSRKEENRLFPEAAFH